MLELNKIDKFDNVQIFKNIEKYLKNCTENNVTFLFEYYDGLKRKKYAVADYFKNDCGQWNGIIGGYFEHDFVNIATVTGFAPMKEIFDIDWEAVVIDWENSQYTKFACPRNAYHELCYIETETDPNYYAFIKTNMIPVLIKLGLDE